MKDIGGYFGLELPRCGGFPHDDGVLLNSGTSALQYLLQSLDGVRRVWTPYYTCHTVSDAIGMLGIECRHYHVNLNLEMAESIEVSQGDYIIANNYFGLKDTYIRALCNHYRGHIIVDNAQALFAEADNGVPTFYSPRKFAGIADGGIACNGGSHFDASALERDRSSDRCSHLLLRHDISAGGGYAAFRENSAKVEQAGLRRMSKLTEAMMRAIDFGQIRKRRQRNFRLLHDALAHSNRLDMQQVGTGNCPLVYPYLAGTPRLKRHMIERHVFCATYWPSVLQRCQPDTVERQLADNLVALPIDQRYDDSDMTHILQLIAEQ